LQENRAKNRAKIEVKKGLLGLCVKRPKKRSKRVKKRRFVFNYRVRIDLISRDKKSMHVPLRQKKSVEIDIKS